MNHDGMNTTQKKNSSLHSAVFEKSRKTFENAQQIGSFRNTVIFADFS